MRIFLILFCCYFIVACENNEQAKVSQIPEVIQHGEECHVCGMVINKFIGPKGQAFGHGQSHSVKFCSTIELFSWALQPENSAKISQLFVHDMTEDHWMNPIKNPYIDAKKAWYVWGHKRRGAMGKTLASFKEKSAAEVFAKQYGGQVYGYPQIDLALLANQ